ncbi:MAG: hypothetical protein WBG70_17670 [Spirulinaceae cyanobacterium]
MPRPNGNPELEKYQFEQKYQWAEPCSEILQLRIPKAMKQAMSELNIKPEDVRRIIAREIESRDEGLFEQIVKR